MTFLMWYDDTPKRSLADKVADARAVRGEAADAD